MTTFEEIFAPISGGRILDMATGNGNFIHTLDATLKEYTEIIGIDTSDRYATAFEQAFHSKPVQYHQMDAAKLDYPEASFDTVCIANSLHHLTDLPGVLVEMQRVLKRRGRLIISEMYRDGQTETQMSHVHLHHWWGVIDTAQGIPHNETYTRQNLIDIAQSLGISDWQFHDVAYLTAIHTIPKFSNKSITPLTTISKKPRACPTRKTYKSAAKLCVSG